MRDVEALAINVGTMTNEVLPHIDGKHFFWGVDRIEEHVQAQQQGKKSRSWDIALWHGHGWRDDSVGAHCKDEGSTDPTGVVGQTMSSIKMARLLLEKLSWSYSGFVTTMTAGHMAAHIIFEELVPLLL